MCSPSLAHAREFMRAQPGPSVDHPSYKKYPKIYICQQLYEFSLIRTICAIFISGGQFSTQ